MRSLSDKIRDVSGPWAWFEIGVVAVMLLSVGVAMFVPTPLLQTLSVGIDKRVFPVLAGDVQPYNFPPEISSISVDMVPGSACVEIQDSHSTAQPKVTTRACNERLSCGGVPNSFEVFRLTENEFYVETGSACDSPCCDWRGMTFDRQGVRLDDTVLHRIYLRLGIPGIFAVVVVLACRALRIRRRRMAGTALRAVTLLCSGLISALLWLNM